MTTTSWIEYEVRYRDNNDSHRFEDSQDVEEWMGRPEVASLGPLLFRRTVTKTVDVGHWEHVRDVSEAQTKAPIVDRRGNHITGSVTGTVIQAGNIDGGLRL